MYYQLEVGDCEQVVHDEEKETNVLVLLLEYERFAELLKIYRGLGLKVRFQVSPSQTCHVNMSWANRDMNTCSL